MAEIKFTTPFQQFMDKSDAEILQGLREGRWPDTFTGAAVTVIQNRRQERLANMMRRTMLMAMLSSLLSLIAVLLILLMQVQIDDVGFGSFLDLVRSTFSDLTAGNST